MIATRYTGNGDNKKSIITKEELTKKKKGFNKSKQQTKKRYT